MAEEIQLKDQTGIAIAGTLISAIASTSWGNSGVASINKLPENTNGFVEFSATENNKARMCGLSNGNSNAHFNSIKYAIYLRHDKGVYIYENGSNKGKKENYDPGDRFKVERRNNKIYYYKNDKLFYTSAATETGTLIADMAFYHSGATLRDVQMSLIEEITIAEHEYNEIDNLIRKDLHQTASITGPLQEVNFEYNIRGWLSKINDQSLTDASDLFGMQLFYQNGANPQSNGNIGQVQWRNVTHQQQQGYAYNYDLVNRLTNATYSGTASGRYNVKITNYDKNGNIKSAERWGRRSANEFGKIDKLTYKYYGNQLLRVEDSFNQNYIGGDFVDDVDKPNNTINNEYSYDANGSMLKDDNKGITNITYNEMNLPTIVQMEGNKRIEFAYTWAGVKLSKKVYENSTLLSTSHYLGAFLHDGTQVNQIITSEGRIVREVNATTQQVQYIPEYHLKDHLGNTRLTFRPGIEEVYLATMETDDPEIELIEESQFRNLDNTRVPSAAANKTPGGNEAARLNKDKPMGPAILLPVLAGDIIDIETHAYFEGGSFDGQLTAGQFLAMVANAYGGVAGGTESQQLVYQNITGASGLAMPASGSSSVPYAHLNYILFDKNYNYLDAGFKAVPSNANGTKRKISFTPVNIDHPGYIYAFVSYSNVSGGYVYFDGLQVTQQERLSVVQADDYYPFGMTMAGLEYRRGDIQDNDYLYNGKELQEDHDLNWYDYGARMYDAALGRWSVVDNLTEKYESIGPYSYCLNDPINAIDPDGNLVIFVNGFMKDHWMKQNNNKTVYGRNSNDIRDNPYYRPYPPAREFTRDGPMYLNQHFTYWGNETFADQGNINSGIGGLFSQAYNDYNNLYINASSDNTSKANDRLKDGIAAGARLIEQLDNGDILLNETETIKIVGHSQGAAFAAGIAWALSKHEKYSSRLEVVYYLAPHQPQSFKHPENIYGIQFSTKSDKVSSKMNFFKWLKGESRYDRIEGVTDGYGRDNFSGGYGGHLAETYINYLIGYFKSLGINVTVYE